MDPRRLWDFLERIEAVTLSSPLTGNQRERDASEIKGDVCF